MIVKGNNTESFIFYAKKDGSIRKFLTANALYFIFYSKEEVEADAILIWLDHFAQARSQPYCVSVNYIQTRCTASTDHKT